MPRRALRRQLAAALVTATLLPATAPAQTPQPGEITASASVAGIHQFKTDLDRGGDFRWSAGIVAGSITRQFTPQFSAGLILRYDFEDWTFSHPAGLGGAAPWDRLNAPTIGLAFNLAPGPDLQIGVAPLFGLAYEPGAKTSDARTYGAILSATRVFSPSLALGAGIGIIRQIDETKLFPYLIVSWKIDDRWRIGNPFPAGPAGGAGLELVYAPDDRWEFAVGGTRRSTRYRLDDAGIAPRGIGRNRAYPLFARAARILGPRSRVEFYAGVAVAGSLSILDAQGATVAKDDYATAPLIGATLAHQF
jgi:hypothetical protein